MEWNLRNVIVFIIALPAIATVGYAGYAISNAYVFATNVFGEKLPGDFLIGSTTVFNLVLQMLLRGGDIVQTEHLSARGALLLRVMMTVILAIAYMITRDAQLKARRNLIPETTKAT